MRCAYYELTFEIKYSNYNDLEIGESLRSKAIGNIMKHSPIY